MPTDHRAALAAIKRFDQLIAFLRDKMDWPIESGDFEELTFDYSAEELGINTRSAARIQEIKRLRPLSVNQPWGVFFVKFEPKRLPVVALRSILGRVALKKRASANNAERPSWAMEDLLFISNYGDGDARQISFAHFAAPAGSSKLPTLKVFGWDGRDTALHLDYVVHELTEKLAWPRDENDADSWRKQWRAAFTLGHREVITTAQQLSIRLAELAQDTRDRINTALEIESEKGRITQMMKAFRDALVHDLTAFGFADMVAQTIAYGLLSARISDPQQSADVDLAGHMRTNPLLRDLMATFLKASDPHGGAKLDFDELGVAEVIELLNRTNMDAVVGDFGDRNPREDPVIHFYESFLTKYDREQRVQRGVFYTPRPVVSYIVRSVDVLLRSEFGLEDGLADTTTWGEMAERCAGLNIPEGVTPGQDFVQILDPATGTGAFLVEVIDLIYRTLKDKWEGQGHGEAQVASLWNKYVPRCLLPRLHGYELQMAPYAIAHLKIGLKLYETGYRFGSEERARVYLTNALEPAQSVSGLLDFAIPALAHEAQAVNEVKAMHRFTVVLGNPPYSGHSANKGKWIRDLLHGSVGNDRVENYFAIDGGPLNERNPKWLNDDYVKFFRLAHWQIERTGQGVVGFITNHSYLDNPTFRGMRESITTTFPQVFLLDLHGNVKKKERAPDGGKEENVFDIQQGVAIGLFAQPEQNCVRHQHAELWGVRERAGGGGKYDWLVEKDVASTLWSNLSIKSPLRLFIPRDDELQEEYTAGWALSDIFPINSVGIVTARDKLAIQWTAEEMERVAKDFSSRETEEARTFYNLGRDTRDWQVRLAQDDIRRRDGSISPVLYRPFDQRFTYYTGKSRGFICMPRPKVMRHMLVGENLGLVTCRQQSQVAVEWGLCGVTRLIIESCAISNKTKEINYLFPLYTFAPGAAEDGDIVDRQANLYPNFIREFASAIGLDFTAGSVGDLSTNFGPENIFHYLYAVLHSSEYRRRYAGFLRSDFPRVSLPGNRALFTDLIRLGARLVGLHLVEVANTDACATFPIIGKNEVDKVRYTPQGDENSGRVWINHDQYFDAVDPDTWTFAIGGYRPAEKWLKDRQGRTLSLDDIAHYGKIIAVLAETRQRMAEVDDIIEAHGGWPAAFQPAGTNPVTAELIPFHPQIVEPGPADRFVNCVPLIPLQAAAGAFGAVQTIDEDGGFEWVAIDGKHRPREGMFVAQVVGKSMEPAIPDGAWCLFRAPVLGTRQGKTVLVQLRDAIDPETGQRYTVKRYTSEKVQADEAWRHVRITLKPVNPNFEPIILTSEEEGDLQVIAELVEVLPDNL